MTTQETNTLQLHKLGIEVDEYLNKNFDYNTIIRMLALHNEIGGNIRDYKQSTYDDNTFIVPCEHGYTNDNNNTTLLAAYQVLTDDEADELAREYIEDYLDDELSNIPSDLRDYFDDDAFVRDVLKIGGRKEYIALYDRQESYQDIDDVTYYIYRTN